MKLAAAKGGGMSLYIIDNAGELVHMERMDGQVFNNIRTALLKAETSLQSRVPTSVYTAQGRNNPAGLNRTIVQFDFFTNSGGMPIVVDGQMIGAIGVGGGAGGGGDENCAIEGLKATFGDHVTVPVYPAAATASAAPVNAMKNASPCVSTSTPPLRLTASRITLRCSARRSA